MKTPSKKKRAALPLRFEYEKQFRKDWDRLNQAGRFDMARLKEVMTLLIKNDGPLDAIWKDHALSGEWKDARDCHVHGDHLLIYREQDGLITFVRTGTHAEIFG